ncbi:M23 family metallopeptidase [Marinobacter caseinilyticus]|uniref:M23 family metallopeptidase n=1 Tax=Marinobacter caseinilyticus TaxID=2692195 RepID=UPI001F36CA81|nr:M23 family metallopeptidase [Marinobacter caseinilyticus]
MAIPRKTRRSIDCDATNQSRSVRGPSWPMLARLLATMLGAWALSSSALGLELSGPQQQGALLIGQVAPGSQVWLNEKAVRVTAAGQFAMGFGREAELEQRVRVQSPVGQTTVHNLTLSQREYDIQRIEGVPSRTVTPPQERTKRIRREAGRVREVRATDSDLTGFLAGFVWPAEGRISGVYGSQRVYNGHPGSPHYGVDIAAPRGAVVIAPASGVVTLAEPNLFYSGGTLIIDHGHGVSSTFLHLDSLLVEPGQSVKQGDRIARVGSTGRSTGPHLDWRMNWYGERVDPVTIAPPLQEGHTPPLLKTDGRK